nr:integrase, catalytic region, zinc finger, CCHC-type, peptidase aspartic, catalytic [Tanacetum cinerariifolium]
MWEAIEGCNKKEVNELRAKRLAKNANPLALVATAQANQDTNYQTSKSRKSYALSSKPSILTRTHTTTRYKGKDIAKPITPPSETAFEKDIDPEQAQRDKDMPNNLALIAKYFKISTNLPTTTSRTMNVAGARENVGSPVVQQSGIQYADEEIDKQELEAHYNYMAKIQEVPIADSGIDSDPLEQNDQNDVESDDERVALANLIANLKLDVYENKKIQKQLKKANTTLTQELKECKTILAKTSKSLKESNSVRDSCLVASQNKQTEFEKYMAFNDCTIDYDKLERVIPSTSVSRPQLKSNPIEDRVLRNNSRGKKQEVEDHRSNVKLSKNKTSVTACNDNLNAKTLNVKSVSMCDKCVLHDKHDMCVLTSVTKPIKRTLVEIILFFVDSGCSKHITGNLKLLINFVEKFLGTVKFRNDHFAPILGYGDLVQGAITIKRVYYIEGLNHNLFSVGQFCDADLEVAFRKSTCFTRDLKGNDLLSGSRGIDLYSITLQDTNSPNPICLVAKATSSQAWLWHRRLSHLNFDTINLLSKNDIVVGLPKVKFVKDHLCSS